MQPALVGSLPISPLQSELIQGNKFKVRDA